MTCRPAVPTPPLRRCRSSLPSPLGVSRQAPAVGARRSLAAVPRLAGAARDHGREAARQAASVLWTYEAGDAIESSAAIADGVVYVGSQTGELHAVNLADGKLKWKYKASADGIGESSPAVAGGLVYIGDLAGVLHAVDTATGKAAWTFKTGSEIKSSPVVAGDQRADRLVRFAPLRARREGRQAAWKVQTEGYVHATPAVVDGVAYIAGCDEILRGDPRHRRQGGASRCRPAPTPARRRPSSTAARTTAPTRTRCSPST